MTHQLNCSVFGQDNSDVFQVTLDGIKSIADLKEAIKRKKKPVFGDIPTDALTLWRVPVHFDKNGVESLIRFEEEFLSLPIEKLKDIFPHERLHVLVGLPAVPSLSISSSAQTILELNCWVLGDPSDRIFPVEIAANRSVGALKKCIKEENKPAFDHVPAKALDCWKVSISDIHNLPENISDVQGVKEGPLSPMKRLMSVFSDVPKDEHIHIIVKPPTIGGTADRDRGREEGRDTISALKIGFDRAVNGILNASGPSDSAKSSTYAKSQFAYSIYDGRYKEGNPRPTVAPPIQLFHPAFGHFLDTISNTGIALEDDMIRETTNYMKAASAIYPDERKRTAKLTPLLSKILNVDIHTIMNEDKTYADGTVEWVSEGGRILLLLKEDKNEFGDGGCDPSTQAGLSAARHWAQSKFERFRNATSCPTFLIASAGPWITVLGVVITDVVVVQRLTDCIWVGLDSVHNEPHIKYVTRFFSALKLGVNKLGSYYKSVKPDDTSALESRYFPSITSYRNDDGLVDFEYLGYLEDRSDCVTLRARTRAKSSSVIVVKFVDRYGDRAHHLLADEGLAPKLLYYGSPHVTEEQPSYHQLFMVVMDYIEGPTLAKAKAVMDDRAKVVARSEIRRALDLLHNAGLVFGDLRSPNIMVKITTGEVKLIDFNWAGVEGQVTYPYLISKDIPWPEGVEALKTIECVHDLQMFHKLFQ